MHVQNYIYITINYANITFYLLSCTRTCAHTPHNTLRHHSRSHTKVRGGWVEGGKGEVGGGPPTPHYQGDPTIDYYLYYY